MGQARHLAATGIEAHLARLFNAPAWRPATGHIGGSAPLHPVLDGFSLHDAVWLVTLAAPLAAGLARAPDVHDLDGQVTGRPGAAPLRLRAGLPVRAIDVYGRRARVMGRRTGSRRWR